jgi:tight adherence protein B
MLNTSLPVVPLFSVMLGAALATMVYVAWTMMETAYAEYRRMYIAEASVSLGDLFSTMSPERVFNLSLIFAGIAFVVFSVLINIIAGAFFGIGAFFSPRMYFNLQRDKRKILFAEQLVDALAMMGNSLRAGLTLPQAIELVVREMKPPITQEFGRVLQDYRLGKDFDESMLAMGKRVGSRDLDILVNSIMITRRSGGNVGEIFGNIATAIRERFRVEQKLRAMTSTGTAQALLMSAMPFMLMGALYFVEKEYVVLLFSTTLGLMTVGIVVFLVTVAFFWIRRIMDLDV